MYDDFKSNGPKTIEESMKMIEEVTKRLNSGGAAPSQEEMEELKKILMQLLEHLLVNSDDKDVDKLISILVIFLQLIKSKDKTEEQELEKDEEQKKLDKNQAEVQKRFIIYEIYKIINPHQIAGETAIANFINNVMLRGIKEAFKYDPKIASELSHKDIKKLEGFQGILANSMRDSNKSGRSF